MKLIDMVFFARKETVQKHFRIYALFLFVALTILMACDSRSLLDRKLATVLRSGDTNGLQSCFISGLSADYELQVGPYEKTRATILDVAISYGNIKGVKIILDKGADVNLADSKGETSLGWLIGRCSNDVSMADRLLIFQMMVKSNVNINAKASVALDAYPIFLAANFGEFEMVTNLIGCGANVNLTNNQGLTCLNYASSPEIAEALIAAGACGSINTSSEAPAQTAKRLGHMSALTVLTNLAEYCR